MAYKFDPKTGTITISGFEQGIAPSPHLGIANIQGANLSTETGELMCNYARIKQSQANIAGGTITPVNSTVLTYSGSPALVVGMWITPSASTITNFTAGTSYYVKTVTLTAISIAATYNGAAISTLGLTGTATFSTVNMGSLVQAAWTFNSTFPTYQYFVLDTNGLVWYTTLVQGTWVCIDPTPQTGASGIFCYGGYVFIITTAQSQYKGLTAFGTAWTKFKDTNITTTAFNHYALVGHDNTAYWCDGQYISSVFANPGSTFDPTSAGTYTFATAALTLPATEISTCLAELGTSLIVGGWTNNLYPWDRISTSFSYPILLPENYTQQMVTANNMLYVFAGSKGNIYITNGSTASLVITVPDYITGTIEPYYMWGGSMYLRGRVWFSVKDSNAKTGGVWSFLPTQNMFIGQDTGQSLRIEGQNSYGTYAGFATVLFSPQEPTSQSAKGAQYWSGWDSGTSNYGIDYSSTDPYTNGVTLIETDIVPLGSYSDPQNFTGIEYKLSAPLVSGESIQLLCRKNLTDNYTNIGTDNTVGAVSFRFKVPQANYQWIQLKAILTSVATASNPSFVRLKELRVYPKV